MELVPNDIAHNKGYVPNFYCTNFANLNVMWVDMKVRSSCPETDPTERSVTRAKKKFLSQEDAYIQKLKLLRSNCSTRLGLIPLLH